MTTEEIVADAIRNFPFWDYGMDDVDPKVKTPNGFGAGPKIAEKIIAKQMTKCGSEGLRGGSGKSNRTVRIMSRPLPLSYPYRRLATSTVWMVRWRVAPC